MAETTVSGVIAAPAEKVWATVRDLTKLPEILPSIAKADVSDGDGEGAIRTCTTVDGGTFREKIERIDEEARIFEYTIFDEDSPFPMKNYRGVIDITDRGDGSTQFTWSGTYEAKEGVNLHEVMTMIDEIYHAGLETLQGKHPTEEERHLSDELIAEETKAESAE